MKLWEDCPEHAIFQSEEQGPEKYVFAKAENR